VPGQIRLFASKILFIPGNHDHHLWESAREIQYANFLTTVPPGEFLEQPWHATKMVNPTNVPSLFANAVVHRCAWLRDVTVMTVYPNLAIKSANRLLLFTHGHFTEEIYSLMSTLANVLFPQRARPTKTYQWEAENFAWIDFFGQLWGAQGRLARMSI
jgi:hypothetical protein